jgi:hypothetical protein
MIWSSICAELAIRHLARTRSTLCERESNSPALAIEPALMPRWLWAERIKRPLEPVGIEDQARFGGLGLPIRLLDLSR